MAEYTPNLNLIKPDYGEDADVDAINDDMDILDTVVKQAQDDIDAIEGWKPSGNGTTDQILRTNGDGTTRWDDAATGEEIGAAVTAWLEENIAGGETIAVDSSLSVSGAAADAKVTGGGINAVKNAFDMSLVETELSFSFTKKSYWKSADGTTATSNKYIRSTSKYLLSGKRNAIGLDSDTYKFGLVFFDSSDNVTGSISVSDLSKIKYIPKTAEKYAINITRADNVDVTDSDVTTVKALIKGYAITDTTLTEVNKPADAKTVGDTICDRVDISGTTWETGAINRYGNVYTSGVGTDKASDYIPVYAPSTIYIPNVDLRSDRYIAGYDGNKNFLRTIAGGTETEYHKSVTITPQADVKYIRITSHQDYYTNNTYLKYSNINKAIYDARDSLKNEVDAELDSINSAMEYVNVFYLNNEATRTVSDVEISVLEDGSIKLNGTASADIYLDVMGGNRTSQIPCAYAGETYTFKRTLVSGAQSTNPRFWHAGENTDAAVFVQNTPYTLTEDEWFYLRLNSGTVFTNAVYQIMLVKGEKMFPYVPHRKTAIDEVARSMAGTIAPKTIKILGIGNSYTGNCTRWLYRILKEAGYEDFVIGAGCYYSHTLKDIYNTIDPDSPTHNAFTYIKYYGNSQIKSEDNSVLDDILEDEPWDVVVLQQGSLASASYESYDSEAFDINDLIQHIKDHVETENLKFGLCEVWTRTASYPGYDPEWYQAAIEEVTPMAANHMTDCDYVVRVGQAVKLARQNAYLDTLGDHLCRPEDHTHIQYGIPSWMCGMVYAITICGIKPCDVSWYAKAANEGQTSNVPETDYMAYLAKQCALQASQMIN